MKAKRGKNAREHRDFFKTLIIIIIIWRKRVKDIFPFKNEELL